MRFRYTAGRPASVSRASEIRAAEAGADERGRALALLSEARPVAIELATDLSPERAVTALRTLPGLALLDSSRSEHERGRYSYLTADPFQVVSSRGRMVELAGGRSRDALAGDPFAVVQGLLRQHRIDSLEGLPPFQGGAVGYFGYDLARQVEQFPNLAIDDLGLPEMRVGLYDWTIAWDHRLGRAWIVATGLPSRTRAAAVARIEQIVRLLQSAPEPNEAAPTVERLLPNFSRADYLAAVHRAQRYIAAGDVYQVNLSQRFAGRWSGDSWALYRRLRTVSPVPHGAYLDLGDAAILSASPECFLHFDGRTVETHPIKGTRPRRTIGTEDERTAAELRASAKDRAENLMIVDLLRNDLGKVCRVGTVRVPRLFAIEGHSHVWQMVSTVAGELRPDRDALDLLRACFPGGSVTGCPKIRAMAIIEELEPVRRGVYCGAIGYLAFAGAMSTSIVIRTIVLRGGWLYLQVGGAIVADSEPEAEYAETLAKAAAPLAALGTVVRQTCRGVGIGPSFRAASAGVKP